MIMRDKIARNLIRRVYERKGIWNKELIRERNII
jgi:hypothetical protein